MTLVFHSDSVQLQRYWRAWPDCRHYIRNLDTWRIFTRCCQVWQLCQIFRKMC